MHLKTRNVNTAFRSLVQFFQWDQQGRHGISCVAKRETRNGPVLVVEEPVIVTYERPVERVLLNSARDANPFFHLYESLWMLAGRNDIAPLNYYLSGRYSQFSDDGVTANGAYGYRWRHPWSGDYERPDQLEVIVDRLRKKPEDRRCVLQMWNVEDDLLKIETSRDVCCNLSVCFLLRTIKNPPEMKRLDKTVLDMTVFNRSNDLIWGMLGANVVHFSFLQEYMATQLGVQVGVYNQVTNNLHVYLENGAWKPEEYLTEYESPETSTERWYTDNTTRMVPLIRDPAVFERELSVFVEMNKNEQLVTQNTSWEEPFLRTVAQPMCHAFHMHKTRDYNASCYWAQQIKAEDWRMAAENWVWKRKKNWENKNVKSE